MSEAIIPIEENSDAEAALMLKVAKMRNRGVSEVEILLYLSETEGVSPKQATQALTLVRQAVGQATVQFNPIVQAIQGILTANDIQAECAKIHDSKGRIAAEGLRLKWVTMLSKMLK